MSEQYSITILYNAVGKINELKFSVKLVESTAIGDSKYQLVKINVWRELCIVVGICNWLNHDVV